MTSRTKAYRLAMLPMARSFVNRSSTGQAWAFKWWPLRICFISTTRSLIAILALLIERAAAFLLLAQGQTISCGDTSFGLLEYAMPQLWILATAMLRAATAARATLTPIRCL